MDDDERNHPDVQHGTFRSHVMIWNSQLTPEARKTLTKDYDAIKDELEAQGVQLKARRALALVLRKHGYIPPLTLTLMGGAAEEYEEIIAADDLWSAQ